MKKNATKEQLVERNELKHDLNNHFEGSIGVLQLCLELLETQKDIPVVKQHLENLLSEIKTQRKKFLGKF